MLFVITCLCYHNKQFGAVTHALLGLRSHKIDVSCWLKSGENLAHENQLDRGEIAAQDLLCKWVLTACTHLKPLPCGSPFLCKGSLCWEPLHVLGSWAMSDEHSSGLLHGTNYYCDSAVLKGEELQVPRCSLGIHHNLSRAKDAYKLGMNQSTFR